MRARLVGYFRSIVREVRNVSFPTKQDIELTSIVILIIVLVSMVFIGFVDFIISKLIKTLLGIM
ncbi:MAG: preprotein translocase subunit SecE [Rickettsiales bacterium]|jgi:preprotein translocase SecE subunit|nr:preprotein translocase subunit SecE [Rickettsiales bacterium]